MVPLLRVNPPTTWLPPALKLTVAPLIFRLFTLRPEALVKLTVPALKVAVPVFEILEPDWNPQVPPLRLRVDPPETENPPVSAPPPLKLSAPLTLTVPALLKAGPMAEVP